MAATKKALAAKAAKEVPQGDFITKKDLLDSLKVVLGEVRTMVHDEVAAAVPSFPQTLAELQKEKEVIKAGPNRYDTNPDWEEMAREIVGEALDHTELEYAKGGGQKFTLVIKPEFSNAPTDYLERNKVDRRTREIGTEGEAGVRIWCELVRNNLKRPKPFTS